MQPTLVALDDGSLLIYSFSANHHHQQNKTSSNNFFTEEEEEKRKSTKPSSSWKIATPTLLLKTHFREPLYSIRQLSSKSSPSSQERALVACSQSGILLKLQPVLQSDPSTAAAGGGNLLEFERATLQALAQDNERLAQRIAERKRALLHDNAQQQQQSSGGAAAAKSDELFEKVMGTFGPSTAPSAAAAQTAAELRQASTPAIEQQLLAEHIKCEQRLTFLTDECEYELAVDSLVHIDTVVVCADFFVHVLEAPKNSGVISASATWPMAVVHDGAPSATVTTTTTTQLEKLRRGSVGATQSRATTDKQRPSSTNVLKTAVTVRCSANTSKLRLRLRTLEGHCGTVYVTTIHNSSSSSSSASTATDAAVSLTSSHAIPLLSMHHINLPSATTLPDNVASRIKYTGSFSIGAVSAWLERILPHSISATKQDQADSTAVMSRVGAQSVLTGTRLLFTYSENSAQLDCENVLTLRLFNDCLLKLASNEGARLAMRLDFNENSVAACLEMFDKLMFAQVRRAGAQAALGPAVRELIATSQQSVPEEASSESVTTKNSALHKWLIPELASMANVGDAQTAKALRGERAARLLLDTQRMLAASMKLSCVGGNIDSSDEVERLNTTKSLLFQENN